MILDQLCQDQDSPPRQVKSRQLDFYSNLTCNGSSHCLAS